MIRSWSYERHWMQVATTGPYTAGCKFSWMPSSSQGTGLPNGVQGWLSDLISLLGSGAGHTAQRVCYAVKGGQDAVQAAQVLV